MSNDRLASARQLAEDLCQAWSEAKAALEELEIADGSKLDLTQPIPKLGLPPRDLEFQIDLVGGIIPDCEDTPDEILTLVPPLACHQLEEHLQRATEAVRNLMIFPDDTHVQSVDPENFLVNLLRKNRDSRGRTTEKEQSVKLADRFAEIARPLDEAFVRLIQIRQSLPSDEDRPAFPGLLKRLRDLVKEAETQRDEARQHAGGAAANATEALDAADNAKATAEQGDQARQASEEARDACKQAQSKAEGFKEHAENVAAETKPILNEAHSLKEQIDDYQKDFNAFQKSLDQRNEQLRKGRAEQDRLIETLQQIEEDIKEKHARAEEMLSHATVAGLASAFGKTRDDLNTELWWARLAFYIAIGLLALSALPMLVYIAQIEQGIISLEGVVARAVILIPGIWLAGFTAKRASSLFRLREHYQYKHNIAASVEGFKKQTEPDTASAIAGTTFYELTRNPAEVMDGGTPSDVEQPPGPLGKQLLSFVRSWTKSDGGT